MDLTLLASTAVSVIIPFLIKGGEAIAGDIGKDFWELIKNLFKSDKNKALLRELENNPEDLKSQGKVELNLKQLLKEHPEIAKQIDALLPKMKQEAKQLNIQIQNSKNVITGSQIGPIAGDLIIGDKKE